MKNHFPAILLAALILILVACGGSTPSAAVESKVSAPKPSWLREHPVDPLYYSGIGSASKNIPGADALKSAQDLALADIASQISVTVTSEILTTLIEKGNITQDEYLATARSQAVADLEGHEFVDSWQDQTYQYAYYRLSKAKYAEVQARKRKAVKDLSLDYLKQARAAQGLGNFSEALNASIQGFIPLIPYLNEALEADLDGAPILLSNAHYQLIQSLISGMTLTPVTPNLKGKLGQAMADEIDVKAFWPDKRQARNLPLKAGFSKGAGSLTEAVNTGSSGTASIKVLNISSGLKLQVIEVSVDTDAFLTDAVSPVLRSILKGIQPAKTRIIIDVLNPTIFLEVSEMYNGKALRQTQVEPLVKNHFVEEGFHFVQDPAKADWQMSLNATALNGTEYSGMFTAFATVNLSVTDRSTGEEIYKNSLKRIKGIDLSYESAANKALSEAALKLNATIIPEIMESFK